MSAFVMVEISEVLDPAAMQRYAQRAKATVEEFGGSYRCVRGQIEVLEGNWVPHPLVILEFPSMDRAREWYRSDAYRPLIEERQAAARVNLILVEGL